MGCIVDGGRRRHGPSLLKHGKHLCGLKFDGQKPYDLLRHGCEGTVCARAIIG